jgi:sorting and assembly machinery component 37
VSMYPVPQRYYVPQRIWEDYYPRLSASGMTSTPFEAEEKSDEAFRKGSIPRLRGRIKKDDKVLKTFEQEKVWLILVLAVNTYHCQAMTKAKADFDIYTSLVSDKRYIFGEQ